MAQIERFYAIPLFWRLFTLISKWLVGMELAFLISVSFMSAHVWLTKNIFCFLRMDLIEYLILTLSLIFTFSRTLRSLFWAFYRSSMFFTFLFSSVILIWGYSWRPHLIFEVQLLSAYSLSFSFDLNDRQIFSALNSGQNYCCVYVDRAW